MEMILVYLVCQTFIPIKSGNSRAVVAPFDPGLIGASLGTHLVLVRI